MKSLWLPLTDSQTKQHSTLIYKRVLLMQETPGIVASEATLHYRGDADPPTVSDTEFFVADCTPKLTTWVLLKLCWTDPLGRSDHIWDMMGLWLSGAHDWRVFFTEVDAEEGGRKLWKKKAYEWWSDNWWIIGLAIVSIVITAFASWIFFAPGKDAYGSKNAYLLPPEDVFDWSSDPDAAKMYARVSCVPFKESELKKRRMDHGPYIANLENSVKDIMNKHQFAALAAIHLGKEYDRCFAGVWDYEKEEVIFMINPEVKLVSSTLQENLESSTFCPGVEKAVMRPVSANIEFTTAEGKIRLVTLRGTSSGMALHVMDQLKGTCICNS